MNLKEVILMCGYIIVFLTLPVAFITQSVNLSLCFYITGLLITGSIIFHHHLVEVYK